MYVWVFYDGLYQSINQSINLFVQMQNKHWTGHQGRMQPPLTGAHKNNVSKSNKRQYFTEKKSSWQKNVQIQHSPQNWQFNLYNKVTRHLIRPLFTACGSHCVVVYIWLTWFWECDKFALKGSVNAFKELQFPGVCRDSETIWVYVAVG